MNKRTVLSSIAAFVFVAVLAMILASALPSQSTAQGDPIPLPTAAVAPEDHDAQDENTAPEYVAAIKQMYRDYYRQFENRTLADYRIAYLISSEAALADSWVSPERLTADAPTLEIAHSWDELLYLHTQESLDEVIIHSSALGFVDTVWTQSAYRLGIVIIGVNTSFEEWRILTGDECSFKQEGRPFSGDFFIATYYALRLNNESDRDAVADTLFKECRHSDTLDYHWSTASSTQKVTSQEDFELFIRTLSGFPTAVESNTSPMLTTLEAQMRELITESQP